VVIATVVDEQYYPLKLHQVQRVAGVSDLEVVVGKTHLVGVFLDVDFVVLERLGHVFVILTKGVLNVEFCTLCADAEVATGGSHM
jgi:hypothetical protein